MEILSQLLRKKEETLPSDTVKVLSLRQRIKQPWRVVKTIMVNFFIVLIFVGGETIRNIIKASDVHIELNRNITESLPMKYFIVGGIRNKIWFHWKLFFLFIICRISILEMKHLNCRGE